MKSVHYVISYLLKSEKVGTVCKTQNDKKIADCEPNLFCFVGSTSINPCIQACNLFRKRENLQLCNADIGIKDKTRQPY